MNEIIEIKNVNIFIIAVLAPIDDVCRVVELEKHIGRDTLCGNY